MKLNSSRIGKYICTWDFKGLKRILRLLKTWWGTLYICNVLTLLFYRIEPLKNGPSLILRSSIARNSSAPNAKRIFQILWGIREGRTNSARPSRPCLKNCQNGTFRSVNAIWNFFGPNDFIWGAIKVPFFDFIQKMSQAPSSSAQVLIWEDKLDYLNSSSQDFKNCFCLWFLWIFSNAGRQN